MLRRSFRTPEETVCCSDRLCGTGEGLRAKKTVTSYMANGDFLSVNQQDNPSVKGTSVQEEVINVRLLELPDLGRGMLAEGIDETVSGEHRESLSYTGDYD